MASTAAAGAVASSTTATAPTGMPMVAVHVPSNLRTTAWANTKPVVDTPFVKLAPPPAPVQPAPLPPVMIVTEPLATAVATGSACNSPVNASSSSNGSSSGAGAGASAKKDKFTRQKERRESSMARNRTTPNRDRASSAHSFAAPTASSVARVAAAAKDVAAAGAARDNAAAASALLSPSSTRFRSSRTPSPSGRQSIQPAPQAVGLVHVAAPAATSTAAQTALKAAAALVQNTKARQQQQQQKEAAAAAPPAGLRLKPVHSTSNATLSAPSTPNRNTPRKKLEYDSTAFTFVDPKAILADTSGGFAVPLSRSGSSNSLSSARPGTASSDTAVSPTDSASGAGASAGVAGVSAASVMGNNIKVILRVRPFNADEIAADREQRSSDEKEANGNGNGGSGNADTPQSALAVVSGKSVTVIGRDGKGTTRQSTYDTVLGMESTQEQVFEAAGRPIAENCVAGYNATIFAYGQTGAGKTHTMTGGAGANARGLIPRTLEYIFQLAARNMQANPKLRYQFTCSFLEIYNEEPRDLLTDNASKPVTFQQTRTGDGVVATNLTRTVVTSPGELTELLRSGSERRVTAATKMNDRSSRSHAVFTLELEAITITPAASDAKGDAADGDAASASSPTAPAVGGMVERVVSSLHLVDLAGSESAKNAGHTGKVAAAEGAKINQSLTTLSRVIKILAERDRAPSAVVPYRESKLTFYLSNALGGNSKTCLIANVSPAVVNSTQTRSTLHFATQCKTIVTEAVIKKEQMIAGPPPALLAAAEADKKRVAELTAQNAALNEMLRAQLTGWHETQTLLCAANAREQQFKGLYEKELANVKTYHELCERQNASLDAMTVAPGAAPHVHAAAAADTQTVSELRVLLQSSERDCRLRQTQLQAVVQVVRAYEYEVIHMRRALRGWQRIKTRTASATGSTNSAASAGGADASRKSGAGVGLWCAVDERLVKRMARINKTAEAMHRGSASGVASGATSGSASISSGSGLHATAGATAAAVGKALTELESGDFDRAFERNLQKRISGSFVGGIDDADADPEDDLFDAAADEHDPVAIAALATGGAAAAATAAVNGLLESLDADVRRASVYNHLSPTRLTESRSRLSNAKPKPMPLAEGDENRAPPSANTKASDGTAKAVPSTPPRAMEDNGIVLPKLFPLSPIPPPSMPQVLSGAIGAVSTPVHTTATTVAGAHAVAGVPTASASGAPLAARALAFDALPRLSTVQTIGGVVASSATPAFIR